MSTVTADIAVSLDGFAAGPNQSEELPFGEGLEDERLHTWMFEHVDQNRAEVDAILGRAPTSWAATCSVPAAANGTSTGRGGGDRSRRTTRRCSC